jgi:hypothetical protein
MPILSVRDRIRVPYDPLTQVSAPVLEAPSMVRCAPLPEDRWGRQPVTITYHDPPPRHVATRHDATDRPPGRGNARTQTKGGTLRQTIPIRHDAMTRCAERN